LTGRGRRQSGWLLPLKQGNLVCLTRKCRLGDAQLIEAVEVVESIITMGIGRRLEMMIDVHVHVFPHFSGISDGQPIVSGRYGRVKVGNRLEQFLPPCFENSTSHIETYRAYMEWCDVQAAVLVQHPLYGYHNEYILDILKRWPGTFAGLVVVDITKGQAAADELTHYIDLGMSGLKIETPRAFQCYQSMDFSHPNLLPVWKVCQERSLIVMIHMPPDPRLCESLSQISGEYKNITFILCHLGGLPAKGWQRQLDLAAEKGMFMDISALPVQLAPGEDYPYPQAQAGIKLARERLGIERLLWGSDYPGVLSYCTYRQAIDLVQRHSTFLSKQEKELLLGGNAAKLFGFTN